jgi:hypothetical protein
MNCEGQKSSYQASFFLWNTLILTWYQSLWIYKEKKKVSTPNFAIFFFVIFLPVCNSVEVDDHAASIDLINMAVSGWVMDEKKRKKKRCSAFVVVTNGFLAVVVYCVEFLSCFFLSLVSSVVVGHVWSIYGGCGGSW